MDGGAKVIVSFLKGKISKIVDNGSINAIPKQTMLTFPFKGTTGPGRACFLTPWLIGGNVNWSSTVPGKSPK